jgi:transcriptional regulator of acetoin/glycerol metabolism
LKNSIQRASLLAGNPTIQPSDLGLTTASSVVSQNSASADAEPDREAIESALAKAGGVVSQAAAELGLSRQALYRRMDRLGIDRP